jgi:hypothetical protein
MCELIKADDKRQMTQGWKKFNGMWMSQSMGGKAMFTTAPPGAPPLMEGTSTRLSSKAVLPAAAPGAASKKDNKETTLERKVRFGEELARRPPSNMDLLLDKMHVARAGALLSEHGNQTTPPPAKAAATKGLKIKASPPTRPTPQWKSFSGEARAAKKAKKEGAPAAPAIPDPAPMLVPVASGAKPSMNLTQGRILKMWRCHFALMLDPALLFRLCSPWSC